jgi:hypothetical protein
MDDSLKTAWDTEMLGHWEAGKSRLRRVTVLSILLPLLLALASCTAPVRVEWSTETEMNTAGFNLYRGESADGPFDMKVNDQLIAPAKDPMTGGKYQYVDNTAKPGVTYYYRLEEVEKNGATNHYGPISVRAGGLVWWQVIVFVLLAAAAVALWVFGGRKNTRGKLVEKPDNTASQ